MPDESSTRQKRNYGIDLLRMVSMFFVAILHVLGQGGVIAHSGGSVAGNRTAWFLEIFAFCCVDCYALISGYVGVKSKFKYSNIAYLWLQVVFYTLFITAGYAIFVPGSVSGESVWCAFFPVMKYQYWYFTAYFCIFFFIPCFNAVVEHLPRRQMRVIVWSAVALFSVLQILSNNGAFGAPGSEVFGTSGGYSALWLAILYVLGAYFRKYDVFAKVPTVLLWLIPFPCALIGWAALFYGNTSFLVNYISPTVLLSAVALLEAFSRLRVGKIFGKVISLMAPLSFSVYLIHVHPLPWQHFMLNRFTWIGELSAPLLALAVIGCALGIYLACSAIDLVRYALFRLIRVKPLLECAERKLLKGFWTEKPEDTTPEPAPEDGTGESGTNERTSL